jgi:SNF2 family DNA or RNA helicase
MASNPLFALYQKLPKLQKTVLQLYAVSYLSINQTQLGSALADLSCKTVKGKPIADCDAKERSQLLRPIQDYLKKEGFLIGGSRSTLAIGENIADLIAIELSCDGYFQTLVDVLQSALQWDCSYLPKQTTINRQHCIGAVRIFLYTDKIAQLQNFFKRHIIQIGTPIGFFLTKFCIKHFSEKWFQKQSKELHELVLLEALVEELRDWKPDSVLSQYVEKLVLQNSSKCSKKVRFQILDRWLLCGKKEQLHQWMSNYENEESEEIYCVKAYLAYSQNDMANAIKYYKQAFLKLQKGEEPIDQGHFDSVFWIFFILALLQEGKTENLPVADKYLIFATSWSRNNLCYQLYHECYLVLQHVVLFLTSKTAQAKGIHEINRSYHFGWFSGKINLSFFLFAYGVFWIDEQRLSDYKSTIKTFLKESEKSGFHWMTEKMKALKGRAFLLKVRKIDEESRRLLDLPIKTERWKQTVEALLNIKSPVKEVQKSKERENYFDSRMVWFLEEGSFTPREQKKNKQGKWTKGRPIAMKRFYESLKDFSYISEQDREVLKKVNEHSYKNGWYTQTGYYFDEDYLYPLVGHPLIFLSDGKTKIEFVKGRAELLVTQEKKGYRLSLSPEPSKYKSDHQIVAESVTRMRLVKTDDDYYRIADVIGKGVLIPLTAKKEVRQIIEHLASDIVIQSDVEGGGGEDIKAVKADQRIFVHLLPAGKGLKITLFVRPFEKGGSYYIAGSGGKTVFAEVQGKKQRTTRDLELEKKQTNDLIQHCQILQQSDLNQNEFLIEEPQDCLELLLELEKFKKNVVLEWPEGKHFKLVGHASFDQFHMNIRQSKNWFVATGKLQIDKKLVIDMGQLLEAISTSGNFIEIGDQQFIALTKEFRKRLEELKCYSESFQKGIRFHPLTSLALEGLTEELDHLRADKAWKDHIIKMNDTEESSLTLPTTLQAELRDYQTEGFHWLAQLAHWGVGACLADDMGLGKTLQALALMLHYAPQGPSLVVAPKSVCLNWRSEIYKFAPTLNPVFLGSNGREAIMKSLKPYDVLICSYGLLQTTQVSDLLIEKTWKMIVLDEAQAIKNFTSNRSKAAMKLNGDFKLAMTGTPIENHLGELWNLFQFINPNFLGSRQNFNEKFGIPIEKDDDHQVKQHLKKLIRPFILRRTKTQVLEELPSRTEVLRQVELSKEESAFYEALRLQAVEKLENVDDNQAGSQHLRILAEIMKLRQACCNPALIDPQISIPSSKLELFGEILEELLENGHKALVFSQFVSHLKLIRKYLDQKQIHYQYLDGQTSAKERQSTVDSFQSGEGELFLISLKAGGVGLNLTAADYVIHMDPWWNPAVEDQASDRAHRIGQLRPVTIYRLVAKGTIEEKIVEMHHEKRNLADSLLEGSDVSGKLSAKDLMKLISSER